ncbi:MAG: efflux RND transporter permease subunit, partial [Rubricoccaceae bacterium]
MGLLARLERRPATVSALAAALLLVGVWAAWHTPIEWEATAPLPEVHVAVSWPGASPQQVERFALAPLENALAALPGTRSTTSRAQSGAGRLTLRLDPAADGALYMAAVRDELVRQRAVLPPEARASAERARTGGTEGPVPLLTFRVTGEMPLAELRRLAEQVVRPELERAGAGAVAIEGGEEVELRVVVRPEALAAARLSAADVARALAEAGQRRALGALAEGEAAPALVAEAPHDLDAWRRLPVAPPDGR